MSGNNNLVENHYMVKFLAADKNKLSSLINGRFKASFPSEFNDPLDAAFNLSQKQIEILAQKHNVSIKIIQFFLDYAAAFQMTCLADCDPTSFQSTLMWAHYAESFEGIAICYNSNDLMSRISEKDKRGSLIRKIKYTKRLNNRFEIFDRVLELSKVASFYDINQLLAEEYSQKLDFWAYENEVRLFFSGFNNLMSKSVLTSLKDQLGIEYNPIIVNEQYAQLTSTLIEKERKRPFKELVQDKRYSSSLFFEFDLKPEKIIIGYKIDPKHELDVINLCKPLNIQITKLSIPDDVAKNKYDEIFICNPQEMLISLVTS